MRTGLELLTACETTFDDVCGCDRSTCRLCALRRELAEYLERAMPAPSREVTR